MSSHAERVSNLYIWRQVAQNRQNKDPPNLTKAIVLGG